MENTLGILQNDYSFLPLGWDMRTSFLSVKIQWVSWSKIHERDVLKARATGATHFQISPHPTSSNLSKLLFQCFYYFRTLAASAAGKQILFVSLWIHLSPAVVKAVCLMTTVFWWVKKNSVILNFCHSCAVMMEEMTYIFFTWQG